MSKGSQKPGNQGDRLVARNKRAHFEYELGDAYEGGLVLIGSEVRSLRDNTAGLSDAWVDIDERGEAWVKGMRIPVMKHAAFSHEEKRKRKILLHRDEITKLKSAVEREGMTIVVMKCYFKANRAKIEVCLARGKKQHDKRHALKEREATREAQAAMRRGSKGL